MQSPQALKGRFDEHPYCRASYYCPVGGLFCCPSWILYVFALPTKLTSCRRSWKASASTRQGRRGAGGRERKVHSGNVFLHFLPHHLLPREHVLRVASDRVVGLLWREREASGCGLAVCVVTGWVTAALFIWSLVAPIMFPDREF